MSRRAPVFAGRRSLRLRGAEEPTEGQDNLRSKMLKPEIVAMGRKATTQRSRDQSEASATCRPLNNPPDCQVRGRFGAE